MTIAITRTDLDARGLRASGNVVPFTPQLHSVPVAECAAIPHLAALIGYARTMNPGELAAALDSGSGVTAAELDLRCGGGGRGARRGSIFSTPNP